MLSPEQELPVQVTNINCVQINLNINTNTSLCCQQQTQMTASTSILSASHKLLFLQTNRTFLTLHITPTSVLANCALKYIFSSYIISSFYQNLSSLFLNVLVIRQTFPHTHYLTCKSKFSKIIICTSFLKKSEIITSCDIFTNFSHD